MKLVDSIKQELNKIKNHAADADDGNTVALMERMLRDANNISEDYNSEILWSVKSLNEALAAAEEREAEGITVEEEDTSTQDVATKVENADSTEEKGSTGTVKRAKAGA